MWRTWSCPCLVAPGSPNCRPVESLSVTTTSSDSVTNPTATTTATPSATAGATAATQHDRTPLRVVVLYGGQSTEHSVSCISAGAIMDHLDPERYTVIPVGITQDGAWVPGQSDTAQLRAEGRTMPTVEDQGTHLMPVLGQTAGEPAELRVVTGQQAGETFASFDLVFPVLHGVNGEDGTVQGLLDLAGIPYVGNGVLASAAGMDKVFTKRLARVAGIPVGQEIVLEQQRPLTAEEQEQLGLPVFVKPARGGSSIGISKVDRWEDVDAAIDLAFAHDSKVLIESMIHGREVECGVLQHPDGSLVASVPAMLEGTEDGAEGFYGFDAKYVDSTVSASIPAPLTEEDTRQVQQWAIETFRALGCEGLARVDFFVTKNGPVLNEINTLPGFTPISMYPQMFLAQGMEYEQLLDTLIQRARVAR
ncbi:D-alanine--D-alanine ligase [Corynebacterium sp. zg254]|uniref:D-alanine--D-alanine ligase n=1 Tax=Corynebacterium zhongnanshanii TaxID=2768834 RepID=A0ABQ6VFU9_9CORY|nr:D-alanine--D-alanine ligase [Corynebacterium zhongnanshanii]MCR5913582.1 D-alanine--D-alanine ligase [Corynebacterium sp. zg254]